MSTFFPALAETDKIGYLRSDGMRREMSIRRLLPPEMSREFLTSLSFDEKIHYRTSNDSIDPLARSMHSMPSIARVFVDCGAFHYANRAVPAFKKKGFVTAMSTWEEYQSRHLINEGVESFLLCSPDHIIAPDANDDVAKNRSEWTLFCAEEFLDYTDNDSRVTPVGVVHGRNTSERAEMTQSLLDLGYEYIAFGGLVPLARHEKTVFTQLTGTDDPYENGILPDSPLGLVKSAGKKSHAFGLNSPDWYRWWKRMNVDSFDGSKLSQEGAASGIIWKEKEIVGLPISAKEMYQRFPIKKIVDRKMVGSEGGRRLIVSPDGDLGFNNPAYSYLMSARCTSPNCPHGPITHPPDPRVTGSIEHNMGRTLLNAWTFDSLMSKIDMLCNRAKDTGADEILKKHWSPIGVVS